MEETKAQETTQDSTEATQVQDSAPAEAASSEAAAPPSLLSDAGEQVAAVTMDAIKIPDGHNADEALGKAFLDIVNDTKLSRQDLAQKLVDMYSDTMGKFMEAQKAAGDAATQKLREDLAKEDAEWQKAAMSDSEWNGDWEAAKPIIFRGREYLGTPELFKFLEGSCMGNHPEILRMFYRAGKLISEDKAVGGQTQSQSQMNVANAAWGNITKKYFDN